MKIAVCAKYVPEATATRRIDPSTKRVVEQVSPDHATTVVPTTQLTAQAGSGG